MLLQFSDPPWYYRWSLIWSALTAVGTIGAVLLALFGDWIRGTLFPPRLTISLLDRGGEPIKITTGNGQFVSDSRYYHLIVSNIRRWSPATDLDVRLVRIDEPGVGGELRNVWVGEVPIHCRNQAQNPQKHKIGHFVHFDICNVRKNGEVHLCPYLYPNNLKTMWKAPCDLIAYFQARSTELDTRIVPIRISWDGIWHDGTRELQEHCKVREV